MGAKASVVIVNWNGLRFLKDVFSSLEEQSYSRENFEVILVDNDSQKDDSVEFTRKNFPWVRVVQSPKNLGFTGGNNLGMQAAKGDYIVLLNNDTIVEKDWLKELIRVADEKKAGAVVSKLMFARQPGIINNAGSTLHPEATWPITEIGANEKDTGQYDEVTEITAFCGASVLLNRKMLEEIGLFDQNFFMYFEDGDLSWRGQKAGWRYYLAPKSVVQHIHTGSSVEWSPLFTYYVSRNRALILLKNAKWKVALKGLLAVFKDRVWMAIRQLFGAIKHRSGIKNSFANFWLGIRVVSSVMVLTPVMLLRRANVLREPTVEG